MAEFCLESFCFNTNFLYFLNYSWKWETIIQKILLSLLSMKILLWIWFKSWDKSFLFDEFFFDWIGDGQINLKNFFHKHIDNFILVSVVVFLNFFNFFLGFFFKIWLKLLISFLILMHNILQPSTFKIQLLSLYGT